MGTGTTRFESDFRVRPDDIDMNGHVHSSRYTDYVLAARYDQMERCYKMPMEEFLAHGFGWVIRGSTMEYKRPLFLGEYFTVITWIEEIQTRGARVGFEIVGGQERKLRCKGTFDYVMVDTATGRATEIPEWIAERYSI